MTRRRVAACVVTGFLGSGKTTLLKGLLEREPGRERIAVIVNELGEIGIDGRVLTGFEFVENVVEFASGCVCCSIDEYRFDLAVEELVRRIDPVLVVLETTGVADPAPTLERLRRAGLGVDAVVCVVDARAWQVAWRVSATARRQIEAADFLVITKTDLVTPRSLARVEAGLARRNPRALVLKAVQGRAFPGAELLLATSAARRATPAADPAPSSDTLPPQHEATPHLQATSPNRQATPHLQATSPHRQASSPHLQATSPHLQATSPHLESEQMESFSWRAPIPIDRRALEAVMKNLPPNVLRAKGLLRSPGDRIAWIFHLVCGRFEMSALASGESIAEGVQAVFLGPGVGALREGILERLEACRSVPGDRAG